VSAFERFSLAGISPLFCRQAPSAERCGGCCPRSSFSGSRTHGHINSVPDDTPRRSQSSRRMVAAQVRGSGRSWVAAQPRLVSRPGPRPRPCSPRPALRPVGWLGRALVAPARRPPRPWSGVASRGGPGRGVLSAALARFGLSVSLSRVTLVAQGGRKHAPVPRSRTSFVCAAAVPLHSVVYRGRPSGVCAGLEMPRTWPYAPIESVTCATYYRPSSATIETLYDIQP
jgi:hypothetical protein